MFPEGLYLVCTHYSSYFGPFFHGDLLKSCDVLGLLLDNTLNKLPQQTQFDYGLEIVYYSYFYVTTILLLGW